MKPYRHYSLFLLLIFLSGPCDKETVDPYANLVLEGALQEGTNADGLPNVSGTVKNVGEGTAYRAHIFVYGWKSWNNLIVTSTDITLNSGNPIGPGTRISFEGVLPNIKTRYEYDYLTNEIKWERNK